MNSEFQKIFSGHKIKKPVLKLGSSYSWPTFDLIFSNKEDLVYATKNGLIDKYKTKLKNRYGGDFEVDRALYARYEGRELFTEMD